MPCPRPLTMTVSSILSKCMALLRRHEDEDGLPSRSILGLLLAPRRPWSVRRKVNSMAAVPFAATLSV